MSNDRLIPGNPYVHRIITAIQVAAPIGKVISVCWHRLKFNLRANLIGIVNRIGAGGRPIYLDVTPAV